MQFFVTAIGGLFLVVGIVTLLVSWRSRERGRLSSLWPTVPGEVIASQLTREGNDQMAYGAKIRYRYSVAGTLYESSRVQWAKSYKTTGGGWARQQIGKYSVGTRVKVYYRKSNPKVAVLEPINRVGALITLLFAAAFTAVGVGILITVWML